MGQGAESLSLLAAPPSAPRANPLHRHAAWGRCAGDPETVFGWTLRAMLENAPIVLLTTLGMVAVVALLSLAPEGLFNGIGFGDWGSGDSSGRPTLGSLRRRAPTSLALLAPIPSAVPWYPVRVRLFRHGARTGYDEAAASFADGWLVVEGRRASFSLRATDGLIPQEERFFPGDGMEVRLESFDRIGDRRGLRTEFQNRLRTWRLDGRPEGVPILPPRAVQAWGWAKAFSAVTLSVALLVGAGLCGAGLAGWMGGRGWIVACALGLCGLWRFVRGVRDLVRLRRA